MANELLDIGQILQAVAAGHSRSELELDEISDGQHHEVLSSDSYFWIREANGFRLPVAGIFASEKDIDLHVVLGVAESLGSGKSLDPAQPEMLRLERSKARGRHQH